MAESGSASVAVLWRTGPVTGVVEVANGVVEELTDPQGGNGFCIAAGGAGRLEVTIADAILRPGAGATVVTVRTTENPFSFFLRDVDSRRPILIPAYGVAVTTADDVRSYDEIERAIRDLGLLTGLQRIAAEPEETYENAAAHTRDMQCQTWLGLSRDMRIFELGFREGTQTTDWIVPRFHGVQVTLPETDDKPVTYGFALGRGVGCERQVHRRLEDGVLPIVRGHLDDGPMRYHITSFVTLEKTPLAADAVRGTHFLVADGNGGGHMFTPEQQAQYDALAPQEMDRDEETVLCFRAEASNTSAVPRYAFLKGVSAAGSRPLDGRTGFHVFESGRVYCISRLNGEPMPQEEMSVLVQPGESAVFEFMIPHRPISAERAADLAGRDFDTLHAQCRAFWQQKLGAAARVSVPERRIDEMVRAGLLHLDLVAYGLEPEGPLAATIGVYCPIGSESSPIIQFMDSMGWHDVARRSIQYFLDKQHDDGFIQNFGGYMLETGAALWTMGEHYRYTRDEAWVAQIAPKVLKACDYILDWRRRNMKEELRGRGYGMIDGKVADPNDPYHAFMLNAYANVGLKRAAEMLAGCDPENARRLADEAEAMRGDIRAAVEESLALAPVVPLGDGTWRPSISPWPEHRGPLCLHVDEGAWWTHGCIHARDSMIGTLYLILCEVLEPDETAADFILDSHQELFTHRNAAFSQPYYCRHDIAHARRGEVGAFLKMYYNTFTSLADRQTYTFWEHHFHASPHKTHEEGWFLMQTRWMLYLEDGDTLRLLPCVPRRWLADGERIDLDGVATYFGPVSLHVQSQLNVGLIRATVRCDPERKPARLLVRLPHPDGRAPRRVDGGTYDPKTESVRVDSVGAETEIVLHF